MRSAQSPSIDFNQMLVVSVFFHFLFFSVFMYLPQTKDVIRHIKPAFTVNFVDIPAGPDIESAPPVKEVQVSPSPPKPVVEKPKPVPKPKPVVEKPILKPKPIAKPKPVAKPKPIPKPVPEKSAASKALVSKLDQLLNKKTVPKKDKKAMAIPKPLDDFENIKMKTAAAKKPTRKKSRRMIWRSRNWSLSSCQSGLPVTGRRKTLRKLPVC
jgi:outer membrane biosynthesis protein TonB